MEFGTKSAINDQVSIHKCKFTTGKANFVAILVIFHPTKPIFELAREFDKSNSYMILEEIR